MMVELRDIDNGTKQTLRFDTEESVERVFVQERTFTCLYTEHETLYLIDVEKCEQLQVPVSLFGKAAAYLKEEMQVKLQLFDERPLYGSVPKQVTCTIKETQDRAATPRYKKAVLENGVIAQVELRDIDNGTKQTLRFDTEESVERAFVRERTFTCLYTEHETVYLIDVEKCEQLQVPVSLFGKAAAYLKEEMQVKLQLFDERPLYGSVPKQVTCTIKETQDRAATPRYKKAVLENGVIVQVPPYIKAGEAIVVSTLDNSYVTRANK